MIKIWEKYILKEFGKFFLFFLGSFYFLYIVVDYSTHMQDFLQGSGPSVLNTAQYYFYQMVKRADIVLPLALLVGTIRVLCSLNTHRELVAFQSAGIPLKKLLRPLFLVGTLCALTNIALNEFALPHSLNSIDKFYAGHLRHSYRGKRTEPLHVMHLEDQSKLIYQSYDMERDSFFDVIWIRSPDDIWRMKYLKADPELPRGKMIDHLVRNEKGVFEKTESFRAHFFDDLHWDDQIPKTGKISYENHSILKLWDLWKTDASLTTYTRSEILSQLLFKLSMPLLSLLVILAISPFCLRYSRTLPQFLIYAYSLFGFVTFIAFMDAAVILAESQTLSPFVAIVSPFILLFSIFSWKFTRAR
ncbi:MAG: hypothetical protein KR126chlam1_00728 [Chlamydiae bacterium]|nr:hypothetical protein [Chlamydiota bacterium]